VKITDEKLAAFVDGELDSEEHAAVERALAEDPRLAEQVAKMRALDQRLRSLDAILDESVPERFETLLKANSPDESTAESAQVVDIAARRKRPEPKQPSWWQRAGALAAAVVVGVLIGRGGQESPDTTLFATSEDGLKAAGMLANALESEASDANQSVGAILSFRDRDGRYCRSFVANNDSGIACRSSERWDIELLTGRPPAAGGDFRPAASPLPDAVLSWLDANMAGDSLNPEDEEAAIRNDWHR